MPLTAYNSRIVSPTTGNAGFIPGEIKQITFSGISATEIDTTFLSSSSKTYAMGMKDQGTVVIVTNVVPLAANKPPVPVTNGNPSTYAVWLGGANVGGTEKGLGFSFSAYLANTSVETSVDNVVTATYTLQITGTLNISFVT